MTVKGGTTPACAACKYQRRRCTSNCPLAPYFPANQPKMFQNVHRLYGVSSITKTLKTLKTKDQKEDAMKSIIYESEMRDRFPVHGCCVIICQLKQQISYTIEELRRVQTQLAMCKAQSDKPMEQPLQCWPSGVQSESGTSEMPFAVNQLINDSIMNGFYDEGDNMGKVFMGLDPLNNNLSAIQAQMDAFGLQEREAFLGNYESVVPFNSTDDRQSYIETKEGCQSSSESSPKDTTQLIEHVSQSDLRNAAADFTLTTIK